MKATKTLGLRTHTCVYVRRFNVCVCIHGPMYAAKVPEAMKGKFFCIKAEVWNESHIVW